MTGNDVLKSLAVEHDDALTDEFKGRRLKRAVHSGVLALRLQQHQVFFGAMTLHSIDVMHHLAGLCVHHDSVQGNVGFPARHEVSEPVETDRPLLCAPYVGVKRVTVQLPLLPVLRAKSARNGCLLAMGTLRLRRPTGQAPRAVAILLVVHQAHAFCLAVPVAVINRALFRHSSHSTRNFESYGNVTTKTKAHQQIGNAVPPLLAEHVLSMATGISRLERAA